jgi:hypothetical protein
MKDNLHVTPRARGLRYQLSARDVPTINLFALWITHSRTNPYRISSPFSSPRETGSKDRNFRFIVEVLVCVIPSGSVLQAKRGISRGASPPSNSNLRSTRMRHEGVDRGLCYNLEVVIFAAAAGSSGGWRYRLGVRTEDSQSSNTGSIPVSATKLSLSSSPVSKVEQKIGRPVSGGAITPSSHGIPGEEQLLQPGPDLRRHRKSGRTRRRASRSGYSNLSRLGSSRYCGCDGAVIGH